MKIAFTRQLANLPSSDSISRLSAHLISIGQLETEPQHFGFKIENTIARHTGAEIMRDIGKYFGRKLCGRRYDP
jgi:hypothetical protein